MPVSWAMAFLLRFFCLTQPSPMLSEPPFASAAAAATPQKSSLPVKLGMHYMTPIDKVETGTRTSKI